MNHHDELMRYQEDVEEQFDDYDTGMDIPTEYDDEDPLTFEEEGDYDDYDDAYIDEYEYPEAYEEAYDNYRAGGHVKKIDPNDRTLTIVVENTPDTAKEAILFGANQEAAQPDGITVDVEESSHKEVREESKANPFKIVGMKYSVSNALQFDNVLKIINRTASGSNTTQVWQPRNSSSPQNFNGQLIDSETFSINVTGQNSLRFTVNPKTKAVFTFTVRVRANMGNLLEGNNVAELSKAPRTTGLPQIDLLRRRKAMAVKRPRRRVVRSRPPLSRNARPVRGRSTSRTRLVPRKRLR